MTLIAWAASRADSTCSAIRILSVSSVRVGSNSPRFLTPDELEDDEILFVGFDVVVESADVGVFELGKDVGLAQKPRFGVFVGAAVGADRLDGNFSADGLLDAEIDLAHSTGPEGLDDPNVADDVAGSDHPARSSAVCSLDVIVVGTPGLEAESIGQIAFGRGQHLHRVCILFIVVFGRRSSLPSHPIARFGLEPSAEFGFHRGWIGGGRPASRLTGERHRIRLGLVGIRAGHHHGCDEVRCEPLPDNGLEGSPEIHGGPLDEGFVVDQSLDLQDRTVDRDGQAALECIEGQAREFVERVGVAGVDEEHIRDPFHGFVDPLDHLALAFAEGARCFGMGVEDMGETWHGPLRSAVEIGVEGGRGFEVGRDLSRPDIERGIDRRPLLPGGLAGARGVELEFANAAGVVVEGVKAFVTKQALHRAEGRHEGAVDSATRPPVVALDGVAVGDGAELGKAPAPAIQAAGEIGAGFIQSVLDGGIVARRSRCGDVADRGHDDGLPGREGDVEVVADRLLVAGKERKTQDHDGGANTIHFQESVHAVSVAGEIGLFRSDKSDIQSIDAGVFLTSSPGR